MVTGSRTKGRGKGRRASFQRLGRKEFRERISACVTKTAGSALRYVVYDKRTGQDVYQLVPVSDIPKSQRAPETVSANAIKESRAKPSALLRAAGGKAVIIENADGWTAALVPPPRQVALPSSLEQKLETAVEFVAAFRERDDLRQALDEFARQAAVRFLHIDSLTQRYIDVLQETDMDPERGAAGKKRLMRELERIEKARTALRNEFEDVAALLAPRTPTADTTENTPAGTRRTQADRRRDDSKGKGGVRPKDSRKPRRDPLRFEENETAVFDRESADTYYIVHWSDHPEADRPPGLATRYLTHRDAAIELGQKRSEQFRCVWIGERGVYRNHRGQEVEDWITFWWSPGTEWGEVPGDGIGVPEEDPDRFVEYRPLAPLESQSRDRS